MPRKEETNLQAKILLSIAQIHGVTVFRNNVGQAVFPMPDGSKRFVRYGLCPGSGDCVGWRTLTITPEMVGRKIAQFVSVEVKTETGTESTDQEHFRKTVGAAGGLAFVARSEGDVLERLRDR